MKYVVNSVYSNGKVVELFMNKTVSLKTVKGIGDCVCFIFDDQTSQNVHNVSIEFNLSYIKFSGMIQFSNTDFVSVILLVGLK